MVAQKNRKIGNSGLRKYELKKETFYYKIGEKQENQ